jgi:hypothetical protein
LTTGRLGGFEVKIWVVKLVRLALREQIGDYSMKRLILSIVFILVAGFDAYAFQGLSVKMPGYIIDMGEIRCEVDVINTHGGYIKSAILSIAVYNSGQLTGCLSRPINDLGTGQRISMEYWFRTTKKIDVYRWSLTDIITQ